MSAHRESSPLKPAAVLSLLAAPMLVLGALLSKMDTMERYYTQLWVVGAVALLCVVASVGSLMRRPWAAWLLTALYGMAASFWLYAAITLALVPGHGASSGIALFPAAIGLLCAGFAVSLYLHCSQSAKAARSSPRNDA